jgi:hypothetical protein
VLALTDDQKMCLFGLLTSLTAITTQLPADGGFVGTDHSSNLCLIMAYFQQGMTIIVVPG